MTRAEIEVEISSIKRQCRGPLALSKEDIAVYTTKFVAASSLEELVTVKDELETKLKLSKWDVKDLEVAHSRVHSLIHYHKGCGQDVNDLILAQPLDGQFHEVACPKCGVRQHWTPAQKYTVTA